MCPVYTPWGLGRDIPVAHGPEIDPHTPSALCESMGQWFLIHVRWLLLKSGWVLTYQDRYVQDERYFAMEHRDVRREASRRLPMVPACPEERYHIASATLTKHQ